MTGGTKPRAGQGLEREMDEGARAGNRTDCTHLTRFIAQRSASAGWCITRMEDLVSTRVNPDNGRTSPGLDGVASA